MTRLANWLLVVLALPAAAAETAALRGYVFREADGSPPRRPMTVELSQEGKVRYRRTTAADGAFGFPKVQQGRYVIALRFADFVSVQDAVEVSVGGPNFAALMLPKRRAGAGRFGTVSIDQLDEKINRQIRDKLKDVSRRIEAGDFAAAVKCYEEAIELRPSAELLDAVALLYLQQGRKDEAYQALERAITRDSKFLFSYAHLAAIYLDEGKYPEAMAVARQALEVDPGWAGGHLLLGEAQLRSGDLDAAARHARTAEEITQGRSPEPHLFLARIRTRQRDYEEARNHLNRFLELRTSARMHPEIRPLIEALDEQVRAQPRHAGR